MTIKHTKDILLECYLNEDELDTLINSLNRDYKEEDTETLEKEYQLQGKLREIIDSFYSKIDAEKFTQMQLKSLKRSLL